MNIDTMNKEQLIEALVIDTDAVEGNLPIEEIEAMSADTLRGHLARWIEAGDETHATCQSLAGGHDAAKAAHQAAEKKAQAAWIAIGEGGDDAAWDDYDTARGLANEAANALIDSALAATAADGHTISAPLAAVVERVKSGKALPSQRRRLIDLAMSLDA